MKLEKLIERNKRDYRTDTDNAHFNDKYITHYITHDTNNKNDWWIIDLDLRMGDKYIITDNKMLTDKHIHAAQKPIKKDFPDIIQQTPTLSHECFYELTTDLRVKKIIQIHNNGNEHWVVSTNNEDKAVFVYDSLYDSINTETLKQIDQVYSM